MPARAVFALCVINENLQRRNFAPQHWKSNKFKANSVIRHISIAIHVFVPFYLALFVRAPSRLLCIPERAKFDPSRHAPCSDAQPFNPKPSTGSGALSFLLSLRLPPAFERAATHFFATHSHPRIYLLHLRRWMLHRRDCNWRAARSKKNCSFTMAQFGCRRALRVIANGDLSPTSLAWGKIPTSLFDELVSML